MKEYWSFDEAKLTVAKRPTATCNVSLSICTKDDSEFAAPDKTEYDQDGVRVEGELQIDVWFNNTFLQSNMMGVLEVRSDEFTTKFNILFTEMVDVEIVVPNKHKRYLWHFFGLGRPLHDGLELFPQTYRKPPLKVYTVTDFRGNWPASVAAVVVANDKTDARRILDEKLEEGGYTKHLEESYSLQEVDITTPQAFVFDGAS